MEANILTPLSRTESRKKVVRALHYLFPGTEFELEGNKLVGETKNLEKLTELLKQKKIRDTIQSIAEKNGKRTVLKFNKQAAAQQELNVYEEHPLGPIKLELTGTEKEVNKVIWGEDHAGIRSQS